MASSSSGSASTPARNKTTQGNNYAAPHTPILSAKRPRSSLERPPNAAASTALSPMHPPRPTVREEEAAAPSPPSETSSSWVGRQVDALFSPVLSFLGSNEEEVAAVTDEDVDMTATSGSEETATTNPQPLPEEEEPEQELHHDMGDLEEHNPSFDEDEFNPYLFIKSLPPYDLVAGPPRTCLPTKTCGKEVTLVLDLDETLVHCTVDPTPNADLIFPVLFHGMEYQVHVRLRPYLKDFLERVSKKFEVVVFTASQKVYADELLNRIDPDDKYIHHRMFRESCLAVEGNFLKDLTVLGRDLTKTVLVDNSPHAFGYQVDNGIPIESWFDDPQDTELLKLERFLALLPGLDDVRSVVKARFRTSELVANA